MILIGNDIKGMRGCVNDINRVQEGVSVLRGCGG